MWKRPSKQKKKKKKKNKKKNKSKQKESDSNDSEAEDALSFVGPSKIRPFDPVLNSEPEGKLNFGIPKREKDTKDRIKNVNLRPKKKKRRRKKRGRKKKRKQSKNNKRRGKGRRRKCKFERIQTIPGTLPKVPKRRIQFGLGLGRFTRNFPRKLPNSRKTLATFGNPATTSKSVRRREAIPEIHGIRGQLRRVPRNGLEFTARVVPQIYSNGGGPEIRECGKYLANGTRTRNAEFARLGQAKFEFGVRGNEEELQEFDL